MGYYNKHLNTMLPSSRLSLWYYLASSRDREDRTTQLKFGTRVEPVKYCIHHGHAKDSYICLVFKLMQHQEAAEMAVECFEEVHQDTITEEKNDAIRKLYNYISIYSNRY